MNLQSLQTTHKLSKQHIKFVKEIQHRVLETTQKADSHIFMISCTSIANLGCFTTYIMYADKCSALVEPAYTGVRL